RRANIITGGVEMGGIKAKAEPLRIFNPIKDSSEVFNFVSQAGPLASGVFQRNAGRRQFSRRKYFVQPGDNLFDGRRFAGAQVRAGVHDQEREAELGGESDLLDEGFDGTVAIVGGLSAEVDEIAGVAKDARK